VVMHLGSSPDDGVPGTRLRALEAGPLGFLAALLAVPLLLLLGLPEALAALLAALLAIPLGVAVPMCMPIIVRHLYMTGIGRLHILFVRWMMGKRMHSRVIRVETPHVGAGIGPASEDVSIFPLPLLSDNYGYLCVNNTAGRTLCGEEAMQALLSHRRALRLGKRVDQENLNLPELVLNGMMELEVVMLPAFLVDPCDARRVGELIRQIEVQHYSGTPTVVCIEVQDILTTHKHWDHAGGNKEILRHYSSCDRCFSSAADRVFGFTHIVEDGSHFLSCGLTVEAIDCSYHTDGSLTYVLRSASEFADPKNLDVPVTSAVAFTGDALFVGGCGAPFEGDQTEMVATLWRLQRRLHPRTLLFVGHEYTTVLLSQRLQNSKATKLNLQSFHVLTDLYYRASHSRRLREPMPTIPVRLSEEVLHNPSFVEVSQLAAVLQRCWRLRCRLGLGGVGDASVDEAALGKRSKNVIAENAVDAPAPPGQKANGFKAEIELALRDSEAAEVDITVARSELPNPPITSPKPQGNEIPTAADRGELFSAGQARRAHPEEKMPQRSELDSPAKKKAKFGWRLAEEESAVGAADPATSAEEKTPIVPDEEKPSESDLEAGAGAGAGIQAEADFEAECQTEAKPPLSDATEDHGAADPENGQKAEGIAIGKSARRAPAWLSKRPEPKAAKKCEPGERTPPRISKTQTMKGFPRSPVVVLQEDQFGTHLVVGYRNEVERVSAQFEGFRREATRGIPAQTLLRSAAEAHLRLRSLELGVDNVNYMGRPARPLGNPNGISREHVNRRGPVPAEYTPEDENLLLLTVPKQADGRGVRAPREHFGRALHEPEDVLRIALATLGDEVLACKKEAARFLYREPLELALRSLGDIPFSEGEWSAFWLFVVASVVKLNKDRKGDEEEVPEFLSSSQVARALSLMEPPEKHPRVKAFLRTVSCGCLCGRHAERKGTKARVEAEEPAKAPEETPLTNGDATERELEQQSDDDEPSLEQRVLEPQARAEPGSPSSQREGPATPERRLTAPIRPDQAYLLPYVHAPETCRLCVAYVPPGTL